MKYIYKIVMALGVMLFFAQGLFADDQADLKKHFLKKIDEVILIVENKKLTKDERNGAIVKSLTPLFDFSTVGLEGPAIVRLMGLLSFQFFFNVFFLTTDERLYSFDT